MNCQALINDFLHDYHAGKLSVARRLEFEFHLTLCRDCRRYVDSYKKTIALSRKANADTPPPPSELVDTILKLTRRDDGQT